jgi:2-polyprenyl-3-methyl-5-hydroxy-6-metoxy-1,4-benzoquinol methylase
MATRLGVWDDFWTNRSSLEHDGTIMNAVEFLKAPGIKTVEDWGCGVCILKKYLKPDQTYIGIDGSDTKYQSVIADLTTYKRIGDKVDAIFMKHVLEHNVQWEQILRNMLESFTKRCVLILFTPFSQETTCLNTAAYVHSNKDGEIVHIPDLSFKKKDLTDIINSYKDISFEYETIASPKTVYQLEHIFYLEKK